MIRQRIRVYNTGKPAHLKTLPEMKFLPFAFDRKQLWVKLGLNHLNDVTTHTG
jgi:hypothetical protein